MLACARTKHGYTCLRSTNMLLNTHTNTHTFKHRWITLISCTQSPQGPPAHAPPEIIERRHTQAIKYTVLSIESHTLARTWTRWVHLVSWSVYSPCWFTPGECTQKLTLAIYLSHCRCRQRPRTHTQANVHTGNHMDLITPFIIRTDTKPTHSHTYT